MANANFTEILVTDFAASMARLEKSGSQSHMRDVVRTAFAAIEGTAWIFRQHIIEVANTTYGLEPDEQAVLLESVHLVSPQGKISTQARFIPLPNSIRLIDRIAARINNQGGDRFLGGGLERIAQRNRRAQQGYSPQIGR
ncbi:MAG: hypothetical protein WC692_12525 [Erythrobacter sp.]|jgi:hypothetical protein